METKSLQKRNELIRQIHSMDETPEETIMFLMAFLDALMINTFSGDIMYLSQSHAMDTCKQLGIDEEKAQAMWIKLKELWRGRRSPAMKEMFSDIGD